MIFVTLETLIVNATLVDKMHTYNTHNDDTCDTINICNF
jgi:hypothetical protein